MRKKLSKPLPALSRCEEIGKIITQNAKLISSMTETTRILNNLPPIDKEDDSSQE